MHLLRQICAALIEDRGVDLIHRDIPPGNIITGPRGGLPDSAKLLNFGRMQLQNFDGRSDIYSPGAVGYHLLKGQPPFVRDSALQVIAAQLCEPVCAPDCHRPDVPTDLRVIIVECPKKDRRDRFQSAESRHVAGA